MPTAVTLITDGTLTPPAFVAIAVRLTTPAGIETEQANVPDTLAVVVHKVVLPGPVKTTILPGVAVPEIVGLVVVVVFAVGDRIATVGTGRAVTLTGTDVVPPGPEAVTVKVLGPVGSVTEQENVPDTLAVVLQSVVLPGPVITIGLPGVAVPAIG